MTAEKLTKRLEMGAYAAIIVLALATSAAMVKKTFFSQTRDGQPPPTLSRGERISVPGQDWEKNGRTLLLVLSTNCKFCTESAPFYRRLLAETAREKNLHVAAVFPQPAEEGRAYLGNLGVNIADVQHVPASSLKVRGTPTLILLDERGAVVESWSGKMSESDEPVVIAKLAPGKQ